MPKTTATVDVYACDNCHREFKMAEGVEPDGFVGTVTQNDGDGTSLPQEFFACRASCVKGAVVAVTREHVAADPSQRGQ